MRNTRFARTRLFLRSGAPAAVLLLTLSPLVLAAQSAPTVTPQDPPPPGQEPPAAAAPGPAEPQDLPPADGSAARRLARSEDVVVTATRAERSLEDVPVSVTVVRREEIERTPARSLDDTLRTVIGLNLPLGSSSFIQPTTNHVSMRGLGGDRALVLVDGVPLNDGLTGYVPWVKAPLASVERVEVARGAGASLFGNYAMGGVVQISTRPVDRNRLEADVSYGSRDTGRLNAAATGTLAPGLAGGLFVDAATTDGYVRTRPEERGAVDVPSASRSLDLSAKLEASSPAGRSGSLRVNYLTDRLGQGTPLAATSQEMVDVAARGRLDLGGSELSATAFYQRASMSIDNPQLVPGAGRDAEYLASHSERPGLDVGGSVVFARGAGGLETSLTAGLDLRQVSTDDRAVSYSQAGVQTSVRTSQGRQTFAGLFAELGLLPLPRTELTVSARLDAWRNSGGQETVTPGTTTVYEAQSTVRLDPRVTLRHAVSPSVSVRGAVYRAFRAPNLSELYRGSATRAQQVLANPDLGPETLLGGDVGVEVSSGGFRGQVNVFLDEVDGLIARVTVATSPTLVVQPRNLGAVRSRGVEVMGSVALSRSLSLDGGYAFTDSVVTDNPANPAIVGKQVPEVPRHAASLSLAFTQPEGISVTARARAQSQRFGDDANTLATDPHLVLDLRLAYPVTRALSAYVSIENLFDTQYVSDVNLGSRLGPPRGVFAGLRVSTPGGRP